MFLLSGLLVKFCIHKSLSFVFEERIKLLINGLSLRVVLKPNLLCKVRFEVFSNIINYYLNKTKPVRESRRQPQPSYPTGMPGWPSFYMTLGPHRADGQSDIKTAIKESKAGSFFKKKL